MVMILNITVEAGVGPKSHVEEACQQPVPTVRGDLVYLGVPSVVVPEGIDVGFAGSDHVRNLGSIGQVLHFA